MCQVRTMFLFFSPCGLLAHLHSIILFWNSNYFIILLLTLLLVCYVLLLTSILCFPYFCRLLWILSSYPLSHSIIPSSAKTHLLSFNFSIIVIILISESFIWFLSNLIAVFLSFFPSFFLLPEKDIEYLDFNKGIFLRIKFKSLNKNLFLPLIRKSLDSHGLLWWFQVQ